VQLEFHRLEPNSKLCLGSRILDPQGGKEPVARRQELNNHVTHFHRATLLATPATSRISMILQFASGG
jgi:hypothetical protein